MEAKVVEKHEVPRPVVLNVRVSRSQRANLGAAAQAAGLGLSEFLRRKLADVLDDPQPTAPRGKRRKSTNAGRE